MMNDEDGNNQKQSLGTNRHPSSASSSSNQSLLPCLPSTPPSSISRRFPSPPSLKKAPSSISSPSFFEPSKILSPPASSSSCVSVPIKSLSSSVPRVNLSALQNLFAFLTFVLLGTAAMSVWNAMINSLYSVQKYIYVYNSDMGDTLTAIYTTASLISTAILVKVNVINKSLLYIGALGFIICSLGAATAVSFAPGTYGVVVYHLIVALGGCCTALFESVMFGYASILPRNYCGAACLGLGLSGLMTFCIWMLFSKVLFEMSPIGVRSAVWVLNGVVAALYLGGGVMFSVLLRQPWAAEATSLLDGKSKSLNNKEKEFEEERGIDVKFKMQTKDSKYIKDDDDRKLHLDSTLHAINGTQDFGTLTGVVKRNNSSVVKDINYCVQGRGRRSKMDIFKAAFSQIFNVSFTLWLTLMMFPNIAPFSWQRSVVEMDTLMGIFQGGDFLGRYLPNVRRWCPWIVTKRRNVIWFALARLVFIPIFMLSFKLSPQQGGAGVLGAFWFQAIMLFLFACSSGWICSLSSMYVPETVREEERGTAATMYLLFLLLGLTIGVWMTKLWKL